MLTHVDKNQQPTMVDVTQKSVSYRMAKAQSLVQLPSEMRAYLQGDELRLKKGPVFQTAIIAGTMAVKKTYEAIPFCHQIPIEGCKFQISIDEHLLVTITCQVKTTFKTGVEMEALHGASVAALTIYDMCKAVSHEIVLKETKLLAKTGGKHTILGRPTYGLVLTGGKSRRMERDKALIEYRGQPHAKYIFDVLSKYCDAVFMSARPDQWAGTALENLPMIYDVGADVGPIGGILTAMNAHREVNWVVVACDLVHFNERTVEKLLANVSEAPVTCYRNVEEGFPEPLCAVYAPKAREFFAEALRSDMRCPVKVLKNAPCTLIEQDDGISLANINTPEEYRKAKNEVS